MNYSMESFLERFTKESIADPPYDHIFADHVSSGTRIRDYTQHFVTLSRLFLKRDCNKNPARALPFEKVSSQL